MKIKDIIRSFINSFRIKRLPPPQQVETKVIPIVCGGKDNERILSVIKKEIDKYSDFYKVFLEEYDGICINGANNGFINPLIIEDMKIRESSTFINPNDNTSRTKIYTDEEISSQILSNFGYKLLAKYDNANEYGSFLFENMREKYEKKFEYLYKDKEEEEEFYKFVIKKSEIWNYDSYLCSIRDWKGLRILIESKDVKTFIDRYTEENLFTILNKAIECYTDRSYNNFFERNIDILCEADKNTQNSFKPAIMKFLGKENEETKEETKKLDKETILELVNNVLKHIDSSGKLNDVFGEKYQSGKILIFNDGEKDKICEQLEKIIKSKELVKKYVNRPHYNPYIDSCIIPINNDITDVPTIIHEFIHQYFENNKEIFPYSMEVPSIFYEKVAIDYLINDGNGQYAEKLQEEFIHRRENDSLNNAIITERFMKYTKIKHDQGAVTMDNILNDKSAEIMNMFEQALYKGRNIEGTKRAFAKSVIKSFSEQSIDSKLNVIKLCSYSLGTFFAEKYSNDEKIGTKMMELMTNPEYTLQMLIDESIALDKTNKQVEKERER